MTILARTGLGLLTAAIAVWAAWTPDAFRFRQRITPNGKVTRVTLDASTFRGARSDLGDLRVVRDGVEVPYLLHVARDTHETAPVALKIVNRESSRGGVWFTVEIAGAPLHNRLELRLKGEEFRSRVRLEAGDNGQHWTVVREAAYVFRYRTGDGQVASHTVIEYPESRRRLLRVTIESWPDADAIEGAAVVLDRTTTARRWTVWTGPLTLGAPDPHKLSCAVADTGVPAPRDRLTAVTAPTAPAVFHRSVTLEASDDGKRWSWLAAGALYRTGADESLTIGFPETRQRYLKLCVSQGDDQPLALREAQATGIIREVYFSSDAGGAYWLYSGAEKYGAPDYDLARTASPAFFQQAFDGTLEAAAANPAYREPPPPVKPFSERYPALLYGVLTVAALGLGWLAIRMLQSESAHKSEGAK